MKSFEMAEQLSDRAKVSLEQAQEALERSNWDLLDAAIYIERNRAQFDPKPNDTTPPNPAYFVSGDLGNQARYATPGFGREGHFDPRTDFNRPHGGFAPPPPPHHMPPHDMPPHHMPPHGDPVPPYKNFPRQDAPSFRQTAYGNTGAGFDAQKFGDQVGQFIGGAAELIEKVVNALFGTKFTAVRNGVTVFRVPLLIFAIAAFAFWFIAIPALVLGLAFNCKYMISDDNPIGTNGYGNGNWDYPPSPPQASGSRVSLSKEDGENKPL